MSDKTTTVDDKSKKSRGHWNMLLSAADPELLKLARGLEKLIPDNSLLHSRIVRRLIGVFKGWAEAKAEDLPPIVGAVVEKLTDLGDMMMGEAEHDEHEHEATTKAAKVANDWVAKMFSDAGKRLQNAADPVAELKKIKEEFAARMELLQMIEAATKEAAEKAKPPDKHVDTKPLHVGKEVDKLLRRWKKSLERRGINMGRRRS